MINELALGFLDEAPLRQHCVVLLKPLPPSIVDDLVSRMAQVLSSDVFSVGCHKFVRFDGYISTTSPVLDTSAVDFIVRLALATNCDIGHVQTGSILTIDEFQNLCSMFSSLYTQDPPDSTARQSGS